MHFFYHEDLNNNQLTLSPEESLHCVKVLRQKVGSQIFITDGQGTLAKGELLTDRSEGCIIQLLSKWENWRLRNGYLHIAVAPTKNSARIEWLIEKCIEIGVEQISFIQCAHSERIRLDLNRMRRIAVSALKQSQTTWLPKMEIVDFHKFLEQYNFSDTEKLLAWCDEHNNTQLANYRLKSHKIILLIGPEGDFSQEEISQCRQYHYTEIKLGNRRLRTETAALYGCIGIAEKLLRSQISQ